MLEATQKVGLPADVIKVLNTLTRILGDVFSFDTLVNFLELHRHKSLRIEQDTMPVAISAYCLALQDVDLICTRYGLDAILRPAACLHEIAHLLLGHIPFASNGHDTPTYEVFCQHRDWRHAQLRCQQGSLYNTPQEFAAETLATLLLQCIVKEKVSMPEFMQQFYM